MRKKQEAGKQSGGSTNCNFE